MEKLIYTDPVGENIECTPEVFAAIFCMYFQCADRGLGFSRKEDPDGGVQYSGVYAPLWCCPAMTVEPGGDTWYWHGEQSATCPPPIELNGEQNPWRIMQLCRASLS
jgi:hypothetical protein